MLRRHRQLRVRVHKLIDLALFALAFWLAHLLRANADWFSPWLFELLARLGGTANIDPFIDYTWLFVIVVLLTPPVLESQGFYDRPLLGSRRQMAWQLFRACALIAGGAIVVQFFVREQLARSVFVFFGGISFLLVLTKEEVVRRILVSRSGRDRMRKRLIVAGTPEDTARLDGYLASHASPEFEVVARLDLNEARPGDLAELLHTHSANAVVLSAKHTFFGEVEKAIHTCELEGVEVWLMADFFKTQISQTSLDEFHGRPMLVFRSVPEPTWQAVAKQVTDFAGAMAMLAVLAVPMAVVAIVIRFSSPGPILFRQERAGLNGRPFTMLKFRSMVNEAEQLKQELAALNEMSGPVFKVTNDPRITRIGAFIRRYSIDELPQLINVIRGEMSLVGPRPLPVDEVARFDDVSHRRRLSVKPGLTCLWQVSGRNDVRDFREWVRLDLEYIDNWSFWLDLKILWRTIPAVFNGSGAR